MSFRRVVADDAEIKRLYVEEGKGAQVIAKITGVNISVIYRRLKEQGVKVRNRRYLSLDDIRIKKLYLEGVLVADIAKEFGASESAIKTRLHRKMNLPRRKLPAGTYKNSFSKTLAKYGITEADYKRLLKKQKGRCWICRKKPTKTGRASNRLHIDHKGDIVRGLLCSHCNTGIGLLRDSIKILKRAILYLARFE